MIKVCTAQQMREIDISAEALGSIPSIVLMENAAISCVEEILKQKDVKSVGIFCGKGNNGGDGLCIARHLFNRGVDVRVYLVMGADFSGDALINYEIISKMGIKITELYDTDLLEYELKTYDVVVDAIFGTGMRGEIGKNIGEIINKINTFSKYILSVDIPSGINADDGSCQDFVVKADKTVTFASYKRGLLLFPGADYCGEIIVKDISIPEYIIENQDIDINIIDKKLISKIMPKRRDNSHKGDYGKVLIIGASEGMSGAVCLAAEACLKSGAGLVSVAVPDFLVDVVETKLTEPMTIALDADNGHISKSAATKIKEIINNFDVCVFGPGIGRSDDIVTILYEILKCSKIPVVIDADGLYALSKNIGMLDECNCNIILTPHEMEMARLSGCDVEEICNNRIEISKSFCTENGVTLVLKGHRTIVTSPAGIQYINISGNCGMATAGSGDVLCGITAAFVARTQNETDAAIIGVYVHGASGDIAKDIYGADSMLSGDIVSNIANVLKLPVE